MNIVLVNWVDAGFESVRMSKEEAQNVSPMPRSNVGFLMIDNEEKVVICFGNIFDAEHNHEVWDGTMVIPKGLVKKVTPLFGGS